MKPICFLLVIFLNINNTFSQNYVDILRINASSTNLNSFKGNTSQTRINELYADMNFPIKIGDGKSILTGFILERIQAKLFANQEMKTISSVCLKLGFNKTFNQKWSGTFILLPKISSDFVSITNKDFQVGVFAFMKYKKSDNLNYRIGLYYNSELFGPLFIPLLGLYYLSENKKVETTLMLPLQADANYALNSILRIGVNFMGQTRSYQLSYVTQNISSGYLTKATNEFYLYLKFNTSNSFSLTAKIGESVGRTYKVYNDNDKVSFGLPAIYIGNKRTQLNTNFSNGLIFQLSLLYRFNL